MAEAEAPAIAAYGAQLLLVPTAVIGAGMVALRAVGVLRLPWPVVVAPLVAALAGELGILALITKAMK